MLQVHDVDANENEKGDPKKKKQEQPPPPHHLEQMQQVLALREHARDLIFELSELSLRHRQVLEDYFHMVNVPNNLDVNQF